MPSHLHVPAHLDDFDPRDVEDFILRLRLGDATLGWEGDTQLELHRDAEARSWEVWRRDEDGHYDRVMRSPEGAVLNPETMNKCILRLVAHDTRRSIDPFDPQTVLADADRREIEAESLDTAQFEEAATALYHGLKKDLG